MHVYVFVDFVDTKYKNDKQEIIPLTNYSYTNSLLIGYEELKLIIS